jgi:AraC-like DNA-binding protein
MDMKISELAELCGFSSDNYFYRFFKKHTGKTPREYREQARKET